MQRVARRSWGLALRRVLFLVHLCVGAVAGAYILVVCTTGAALVLRTDLQRTLYPHLFESGPGPAPDLSVMLRSVQAAYPDHAVTGIDAPTATRATVLAYVARGRDFLTVLADPVTGRVLGELPEHTVIRTLQDLHFNLLSGRTGRVVNGIGACCLLVMCVTGVVIWWPRGARWRHAFRVHLARGWKRAAFDLHRAGGICAVAVIAMWALTGIYFTFPSPVRSLVNRISPLSAAEQPSSDATRREQGPLSPSELIAAASRHMPGRHPARVVLPETDTAPVQVLFARVAPTPLTPGALALVYLDRYTGEMLTAPQEEPSVGDRLLAWAIPLHVGNFAGPAVRALWFAFALVPPLLYVTGMVMWWTRARRTR